MKDTLREKNVTIKDLNRTLESEKKKVADLLAKLSNSGSNSSSSSSSNSGGGRAAVSVSGNMREEFKP